MKLKATSLSFALFIVFFISILMSSLILLYSSSDKIQVLHQQQRKLMRNAESGVYQALMLEEKEEGVAVDLFGDERDSVFIEQEAWGLFTLVHSKAFTRRDTVYKAAFTGEKIFKKNRACLYLADKNAPLSICGETRIEGEVYIPKSGVKRAYIEGQNYNGDRLIYGAEKRSERFIPPLNKNVKERMLFPLDQSQEREEVFWTGDEIDSLYRPFDKLPLYFFSDGTIRIQNQKLRGKILIDSKSKIEVAAYAELEDVILMAPEVIVESGFEGRIQIFSKSVQILEEVYLKEPSVVAVASGDESPQIEIKEESQVNGLLIAQSDQRFPAQILLEEARLEGILYNDGLSQIVGEIDGAVYSSELILKTASSVYKNHLLHAKIGQSEEIQSRVFPSLLDENKSQAIERWLN